MRLRFWRKPLDMNKEIRKQWARALRSGDYQQGLARLTTIDSEGNEKDCCLGVLCKLAITAGVPLNVRRDRRTESEPWLVSYDSSTGVLPQAVMTWAGLHEDNPAVTSGRDPRGGGLAGLNDRPVSFRRIANLIEGR